MTVTANPDTYAAAMPDEASDYALQAGEYIKHYLRKHTQYVGLPGDITQIDTQIP